MSETEMAIPQGVYITTAVIYAKLLEMESKLLLVEERQTSSKPDSDRIRGLEKQVAALYVIGAIATTVFSALLLRGFS